MAMKYHLWQSLSVPAVITFLVLWSCYPLFLATAQQDRVTRVRGVTGQKVSLPCTTDTPEGGGEALDPAFILYSFETPRGPAGIYRVNNLGGGKVTHWAARDYKRRAVVYWRPGDSPATLVLDNIGVEDEGVYRCYLQTSTSSTAFITSAVNLSVYAPPDALKIYSDLKPDSEISGIVGPYDMEETVTFSCKVTNGHPRPNVTWWEDSQLLEYSPSTHTDLQHSTTTRSDITVGPLTFRDLHRKLTCRASNSDLYDPLETSITLDLRYPPKSVRIMGEKDGQLIIRAGERQKVVCEVLGGRPRPSIMLRLNNALLTSRSDVTGQEMGERIVTSKAQLVPREEQDGSVLTCIAETPPFQHTVTSVQLIVSYLPRVKLRFGRDLKPGQVKEGDNFTLQCQVTANPSATAITWSFNGKTLVNVSSQGVQMKGPDLYLKGVNRASSGEYRCAAINVEGEGVSDSLYLNVRAKPEAVTSCSVTSSKPSKDKAVTLEVRCVAKADGDLSKIFLLEVKRVGRSKAQKRQHKYRPVFAVKGLREGQYQLTVVASNDLGESPPYTFNHTIQFPTSSISSSSPASSSSVSLPASASSSRSSSITLLPHTVSSHASSSSSSSSISVSPSLTSASASITALTSATVASGASSISPTPSFFSFSLSTSFSPPISPYSTNSFSFRTPPPGSSSSSSSSFLPSPPPPISPWRNPWAVVILVIVGLTAIAHVGCLVPQLLATFFAVKMERRPPPRQRLPSPRFPRRRRSSNRELIRAHRLSEPPMQLPTITISGASTPISYRKGSLTLDYTEPDYFISTNTKLAPHASVDSMELSSMCPSLQDEHEDTYSLHNESVQTEQPLNGTLPRARPQNGCVVKEPLLNNNLQNAFLQYNFIEKESLKRDLMRRPRSRSTSPNFLSVDMAFMSGRRAHLKEASCEA